jgi:hypothetical protein
MASGRLHGRFDNRSRNTAMPILMIHKDVKEAMRQQLCGPCAAPAAKTWAQERSRPTSLDQLTRRALVEDIPTRFGDLLKLVRAAGIEVVFERLPGKGPGLADASRRRIVLNTDSSPMRKLLEDQNLEDEYPMIHVLGHELDHIANPVPRHTCGTDLQPYEQAADSGGSRFLNDAQFKTITEFLRSSLVTDDSHGSADERVASMEQARDIDKSDPARHVGLDDLLKQTAEEKANVQRARAKSKTADPQSKGSSERNWGANLKDALKPVLARLSGA